MAEITKDTEKALQDAWPKVMYNGQEFFDPFYDALEKVEERVFRYSDFQDHQEVYVGYLPDTDEFLVGWDAWHHARDEDDVDYFGSKIQSFKFDGKTLTITEHKDAFDNGFYSGFFKERLTKFPNLKDLRLD